MPVFRTGQILASNNPRLCLLPDEVQRWGSILNPTNGGINSISQCAGRIGGQVTTCQSIQGQENGGLPDNCEIITNTLYLDMTNNNTDGKLQYITTIYGHLYIRSTNTSKISFPALERILVSDIITPTWEDPAVLFDKNGNLSTIEFPKLTR
ncbi:hypothetical protein WR25_25050 [Diploscapter pachys]|uniref:Receptor L-domain domain-containing protein n=1 Tax=Diploscapter pachys TaxID=2018661 RepID=A0A2A2K6L3_9BILA|nr:hypothetical protein WR25_25050 [Diploscapter pachys]